MKKKRRAEINGGPGFKETAGSWRIPCEECVVTGENPSLWETAAHAERAPATVEENPPRCGERRREQEKEDRQRERGEGETGRV